MEALSLLMLFLAGLALGLIIAGWLVSVASFKRGYRAGQQAQALELERWKTEALASRLQIGSINTVF